jgi:hypothetical protein
MTPVRIAVVAVTTHHRAALGRVNKKNGRAERPVDEDKAEIGRNQRRKRQCPRIRFRQILAQGHDEETGDEGQHKDTLQQAP